MERLGYKTVLALLTAGLALTVGCSPYAERKAAMESHWDKSSARAKLPMAEEYLRQGQLKDAYKLLGKCLQADPELATAHFLMGRVCLAQGQTAAAEESFGRAATLDPALDEAWFALGMMAQDREAFEAAATHYRKALELKPLRTDYILRMVYLYDLQGQTAAAQELLETSIEKLPSEVDLLLAQAEMVQRRGEYEQAAALLQRARLQSNNNPHVLELLGTCYMSQQEWSQAEKVFEELLQTPDLKGYETILQWTATCSLNAGHYSRALKYFDQLSVYRREDPALWLAMAQAALGAQLPARGLQCAEKALSLQPGWAEALAVQGCAYYMEKQYAQAAAVFERLDRDEKWNAFGWWMSGRCYRQLGQVAKAQQAFQKASALDPNGRLMKMFTFGPDESL